jgi:DNA-directed RNA polymerase specialized sigma24 family protein
LVDPDLVERAQRGDVLAFERLVEARVGPMTRTAMAILGREDEARDAVQDALVATCDAASSVDCQARLLHWEVVAGLDPSSVVRMTMP